MYSFMVTAAALSRLSASFLLFPLFVFFAEAEGPWVALTPSPLPQNAVLPSSLGSLGLGAGKGYRGQYDSLSLIKSNQRCLTGLG